MYPGAIGLCRCGRATRTTGRRRRAAWDMATALPQRGTSGQLVAGTRQMSGQQQAVAEAMNVCCPMEAAMTAHSRSLKIKKSSEVWRKKFKVNQ